MPGISASSAYLLAFGYTVLFALCVLAHELGHTAVSLLLRHPVRRVVIFLLGGVSEIEREPGPAARRVPDRGRRARSSRSCSPAAARLRLLRGADTHTMPGVLLLLLSWSNLVVVVFNILPGPAARRRTAAARRASGRCRKSRLTGTSVGAWAGRGVAVAVIAFSLVVGGIGGGVGIATASSAVVLGVYLWFGAGQSLELAEVLRPAAARRAGEAAAARPAGAVPTSRSPRRCAGCGTGSARGLVVVDATTVPRRSSTRRGSTRSPPDQRPWVPLRDGRPPARGRAGPADAG